VSDLQLAEKIALAGLDPAFPSFLARSVRIIALDVDGVLTDGGLYYNDDGLFVKRFDVADGMGVRLAAKCGLETVVISGMRSGALRRRAEALDIRECHDGCFHKLPKMREILEARGLSWGEVACVGDDIVDLPLLRRAGLSLSVLNAQPEVRAAVHYTAPLRGGHGAVRHLIRHILAAQGRLVELTAEFLDLDG
jgi:3-deoxy-D-manno-octulosonate 8-phosphate phosphatase (KDO 8-P phosphatase)